jgi:hypothetical protein
MSTDKGFAPNPFWGYCTLATCKPTIRRTAQQGDWVAGFRTDPHTRELRLVYVIEVTEDPMPFQQYDTDRRFLRKRPVWKSRGVERCGDNIYFPLRNGSFGQRPSFHNPTHMERDLRGRFVLISKNFYYFGSAAQVLPTSLRGVQPKGRGHRSRFQPSLIRHFIAWLGRSFRPGRHAPPSEGPLSVGLCDCHPAKARRFGGFLHFPSEHSRV